MWKLVVTLAASAVMAGCATEQQQIDAHASALNSWVGAPIDEFLYMQGAPTTVIERADYQIYKFVAWKRRHNFTKEYGCSPPPPGSESSGNEPGRCSYTDRYTHTVTFSCVYELLVAENVINDWRMNGNNCRMITVSYRPS